MHILNGILLFCVTRHWMQIPRYTAVTSPSTEWPKKLFCMSTSSAYWVKMSLLVRTYHMYPPSNHRKSSFAAAAYRASALCSGSAHFYRHTHTPTHIQTERTCGPRPGKRASASCRTQKSETMIKRKLSEYIWLRTFVIAWCNHSDWYHFAMRFLIVVKVSGWLSKTVKNQNALNNAPLSLSKLSGCYKGAGLLPLLIFIMALKANVPLVWRLVYLKAAVQRRRYVFKRLFVVLLHVPWGKTKDSDGIWEYRNDIWGFSCAKQTNVLQTRSIWAELNIDQEKKQTRD